ncbi:MAG: ATP phosphoribosyltransferase [Chloroflexota bacterium]
MASLRVALPSDGALYEDAGRFMQACGLRVSRPSSRRYTAAIPTLPGVEVLFQRASDITQEVDGGTADLGIVGLDRFQESRREGGDTMLLIDDLDFGGARLVIAVPDAWLDVTTMADLADLAFDFRQRGRELRIATKYPRLVRRFMNRHGINYFTLVHASGGLEAAPIMGYADLIADISASGNTLRENRMRTLADGVVLRSQATLIANLDGLQNDDEKLGLTRELLERVEAQLRSRDFQWVSANIEGGSAEDVAEHVMTRRELAGMQGPTISRVHSDDHKSWFAVQVVVRKEHLVRVVDHFRQLGGSGITVNEPTYVFRSYCEAYSRLLKALGRVQ